MDSSVKRVVVIAGLTVNIFSNTTLSTSGLPIAILFLLHGRTGLAATLDVLVENILRYARAQAPAGRELLVVTLDHRNHGTRLVNSRDNDDWAAQNDRHAIDMYAIQSNRLVGTTTVGTASDVSFLIDFLPAYLFPFGERDIVEWMLGGISLGGHSTWICLKDDPRIKIGIPIIGCPDYLTLMRSRAELSSLAVSAPHFPPSLIATIERRDPASTQFSSSDPAQNPFIGKKILVLAGGKDVLVPWSASRKFIEELQVGSGTKKVVVDEEAGHECSLLMVRELLAFVWEHGINIATD